MPDVTLTEAALAEIEARANAATPGPWRPVWSNPETRQWVKDIVAPTGEHLVCFGHDYDDYGDIEKQADVIFIAHARADVPALIAALRASRERERRYETAGRMWVSTLDAMRMLTTHHADQVRIADQLGEAEKQMRAALGEEAKS